MSDAAAEAPPPSTRPVLTAPGPASGQDGCARDSEILPQTRLSALIDPALDPLFWRAARLGAPSAWWLHVPFGHWIVHAAAPRVLVELGTQNGVSYSAFCQAVIEAGLPTRCHAVDTWRGDRHSGEYGDAVYEDFDRFHDGRYDQFSTLLRCTFDDALAWFTDGSIDLLHIDGLHTYEAVQHDFECWLPKLSDRGVVLFHDTNVRYNDFGVWQFWEKIRDRYPSFEFLHGYGLGILAVGENAPAAVLALCRLTEPTTVAALRSRFKLIAERWLKEERLADLANVLGNARAEAAELRSRIAAQEAAMQAEMASLRDLAQIEAQRSRLAEIERDERAVALHAEIAARDQALGELSRHAEELSATLRERDERAAALHAEIAVRDQALGELSRHAEELSATLGERDQLDELRAKVPMLETELAVYSGAIAEMSASLFGWRRFRSSYTFLGDRARDARRWELAARFYRKALRRNPQNPPIWVQYGHALKESGRLAEAENAYRKAIYYAPDVAASHLQLGHALKLRGKGEAATAAYLRAHSLDPTLVDPLAELRGLGWPEAEVAQPGEPAEPAPSNGALAKAP